jgi:CelD/BcsL family acetyltransferase involved in cellulose biosynthesis
MSETSEHNTDTSCETSLVTLENDLRSLRDEWSELFLRTRCENVFLSYEWMSNWWNHFGGGGRSLFIVLVRGRDGRLQAIAPFQVQRVLGPFGPRRLAFLADEYVGSDFLDVIADESIADSVILSIRRCLQVHRREWDFIELRDTLPDSKVAIVFREKLRGITMQDMTDKSSLCPFIRLPHSFAEYLASRGQTLRRNYRYYLRQLSRETKVEFVEASEVEDAKVWFEELARLHYVRSGVRGYETAFAIPKLLSFHRAALSDLCQSGFAKLFVLKAAERAIAVLYVLTTGARMLFYQSGIDPEYGKFSPGVLMFGSAIEAAIKSGHAECDLLRGDEEYKFHWATDTRQMITVSFFDARIRSQIVRRERQLEDLARGVKRTVGNTINLQRTSQTSKA